MQKLIFSIAVLFTISISAQSNYEVVIIPKKFSFLNETNQYNLNAVTKSFFETEGFKVYYAEENLPKEIANNRCNVLFADVVANNTFFVSKLEVVLLDCQNNILYTSLQGTSREKDYKKAYNEALRSALVSLRGKLKIENLNAGEKVLVNKKNEEVKEELVKKQVLETKSIISINSKLLSAISTTTGYNLVNSQKSVVMVLYKTSVENIFIADKGNEKGVLLKKNNEWYFEYNFDDAVFSEKVEVKF